MKLIFKNPVVIARKGELFVLVDAPVIDDTPSSWCVDPTAMAQFWSKTRGYSSPWRLQDLLNLMTIKPIEQPEPWQEPSNG